MEATKEWRERKTAAAAEEEEGADTLQLPMETSPYVRYDGLEDYKMRGYDTQGHLPVSDVPHGGCGTDAPTIPGNAVPVAQASERTTPSRSEIWGEGRTTTPAAAAEGTPVTDSVPWARRSTTARRTRCRRTSSRRRRP
jgi:hypothetical protein